MQTRAETWSGKWRNLLWRKATGCRATSWRGFLLQQPDNLHTNIINAKMWNIYQGIDRKNDIFQKWSKKSYSKDRRWNREQQVNANISAVEGGHLFMTRFKDVTYREVMLPLVLAIHSGLWQLAPPRKLILSTAPAAHDCILSFVMQGRSSLRSRERGM